jgi:hypothetical protein
MIRRLRLSDVARQLLPKHVGGTDLACTHAGLTTPAGKLRAGDLARWSVATRKAQQAVASVRAGRLETVVLLRERLGPRSWEVAHLFSTDDGMEEIATVLDQATELVGSRGGERLFLRVPADSPLQNLAQQSGFFAAYSEEVYGLHRSMQAGTDGPALSLRPPLPADTYGQFRLYSAALPSAVRAAAGLTLDQFLDSRETVDGSTREFVWAAEDGQVHGWVRLSHLRNRLTIDAMLHPDDGTVAGALLADTALLAWGHTTPSWIVASYQPDLSVALHRRGWEVQRSFAVLIKSAAGHVREPALMPAPA